MNTIFGIPADTLLLVLLGAFGICIAFAAWILIRNRVIFRLGIRNIPRRPAQTILIIIGLMLSTTIIAAALTTGDILDHTIRSDVFEVAGYADELVIPAEMDEEQARPQAGVTFPETVVHDLRSQVGGDPNIDGLMPVLSTFVPALHPAAGLGEPALVMVGLDFEQIDAFGGLTDLDGNAIDFDALGPNQVILGQEPAGNLQAAPGDQLTIFVENQPIEIEVAAVAEDSLFTGMNDPGMPGGFAMTLEAAQQIADRAGQISYIAVTNHGGIEEGVELTDEVVVTLRSALESSGLNVVPVKQQALETAEEVATMFSSIFMVFGMFSIAAGILLIFLIFVLLAAERKPEMGISRAIGMKRRQLTQMFMAEGLAYDLGAALIGALLGIGVAVVMVDTLTAILGDEGFTLRPTASWRSLMIAFMLGVTITFITIAISAWRISRLNIVASIRNLPDPEKPQAGIRGYVLAIAGLTLGAIVSILGYQVLNPFLFGLGLSLLPLSLAYLLHKWGISGRLVYSLAALFMLIYWLFPVRSSLGIAPDMSDGGIEMFILSGVMLVSSATLLMMWNADLITQMVALASRRFTRWVPAVKTAVSYPMANRGRTGLTIAMFSLIIFSLVVMASLNVNFSSVFGSEHASAGWDVQLTQAPNNPIDDVGSTLAAEGFDTEMISATGRVLEAGAFTTELRLAGDLEWGSYQIAGANDSFFDNAIANVPVGIKSRGYETDQEIWEAVRTDPTLAVVDAMAVPNPMVMMFGLDFELPDVAPSDQTMEPVDVEVRSRATGETETVTIIGVIDSRVSLLLGVYLNETGFAQLFELPTNIVHYAAVSGSGDMIATAESMEKTLVTYGVQASATEELLQSATEQATGFFRLYEGFMALGLIIGIAALGVITFRTVVERRQQIGMLRALGYRRSMLAASFVLESTIITVLGVLSGVALGLLLSWQIINSEAFSEMVGSTGFIIPWLQVLVFAGIALGASLLMAWIPARRAARVPVAEALRYE